MGEKETLSTEIEKRGSERREGDGENGGEKGMFSTETERRERVRESGSLNAVRGV